MNSRHVLNAMVVTQDAIPETQDLRASYVDFFRRELGIRPNRS